MDVGGFVIAIVVGLIVGALAGRVVPHGGYGRFADMLLGVAGSTAMAVAAWIGDIAPAGGVIVATAVAVVGAGVVLVGQRKLAPAQPVAPIERR